MAMAHWKTLLAGLVLGLGSICPVSAFSSAVGPLQGNAGTETEEARLAPKAAPPLETTPEAEVDVETKDEIYRVGPGDVLDVVVYGEDDLTRLVTVQHGGEISFPLIGEVQVEGLTLREVRERIEELLAKDYLVDPQVSVKVKEYLSQWVTMVGEIARPGKYYLNGPKTLLDLLTESGGFTAQASGEIVVTRLGGVFDDGSTVQRVWLSRDMSADEQRAILALNVTSNDLITVPAQEAIYVTGEVNNPGSFPLKNRLTVLQAVSLAGGLSKFGSKGKVEILRKRAGAEPERIKIDLEDIENGKKPDIPLVPGDMVKVGKRIF
ncbi:MAG TPA: polysaccharide biosynthesis/export family protein [Vicinamibacteria bacterium]